MIRTLVILLSLGLGAVAHAESKADKLFNKGKDQLAAKNYAEACATFEEVDKLDPAVGVKLNIAKCYEEWGKLTKAYDWYIAAQKQAIETKDKRIPKVKELVEAIDADVPRLTLKLPAKADPAAAKVTLDGAPFPVDQLGKEQKIDPGSHKVDYFVAGKPKTKAIELEKGAATEIELPFDATATPAGPAEPDQPAGKRDVRKLVGYSAMGAGLLGLGIASFVTLSARSSYKSALTDHCGGAKDMCDDTGLRRTKNALHRANIATVVSIVSAVAVGAGVALYLTAPSRKTKEKRTAYLAPAVSGDGVAAILGGRF